MPSLQNKLYFGLGFIGAGVLGVAFGSALVETLLDLVKRLF